MHGHFDAAMLIAIGVVSQDVNSARPDAPVVRDVKRARRTACATRMRSALARALDHAARAVEPPAGLRRPSRTRRPSSSFLRR
jgi:hypothetical protein